MVRIGAGIDHVTDGLRGDFLNGRNHGVRARGGSGVDHHHAIRSHLKANVGAGARNHVKVGPKLKHFQTRSGTD